MSRAVASVLLIGLFAPPVRSEMPAGYTIPTVDLAAETFRQVVVDREAGQYLGHPSTLLLPDNKTLLITYPKGHGRGGIIYKRSYDGGVTWTDRLPVPENWSTSLEVPTLFRLIDPKGVPRILMFSGKGDVVRVARSEDDGETWTPLQPIRTDGPDFSGIVTMGSMVALDDGSYMAFFHDDGRWLRRPAEHPEGERFKVFKTLSEDGGLSWSQPEVIAEHPQAHLCEPGALRSPDGKQIAVLLRENSRRLNSFVIFSDDEGKTWSNPRELPAALTGDRHTARYAPDGRLFISFRDQTRDSPTWGDFVGWVGTYQDIVDGAEGQYRVRLMDNHERADTTYPGVELLPDGTFVVTTYGHWVPEEESFIVSVRFKLEELDQRAAFSTHQPTSMVLGTTPHDTLSTATPAQPAVARAEVDTTVSAQSKPNVVFVAFDDLNDWWLEPESPLHMPNLDRLARQGISFTQAYTASPACNPSRAALLLGRAASSTGIYGNRSDWRRAQPEAVTLPRFFIDHGYRVEGAGKIFHHHFNSAFHDPASFHHFQKMQLDVMPRRKLNGIYHGVTSPNYDWGPWPMAETEAPDVRTVDFGIDFLERPHSEPFFLAIGIFRPHMPFFAPPKYFSHYPRDQVVMPKRLEGDLDDIPSGGMALWSANRRFFDTLKREEGESPGTWEAAVRAYQASSTFADHQLGRLLDALAMSPHRNNTIIVVWSDHGYHLGEKEHWEKFALWEKATRVPLIIVAPGVTQPGSRSTRPVSLLDLYPTLIELAGLPRKDDLDGLSLVPLLKDPAQERARPAVMTYGRGNHAVRSERWRYIRYADGSEELYDEEADPNEWRNLASDPAHTRVIERLQEWLPKQDAPPVADLVVP